MVQWGKAEVSRAAYAVSLGRLRTVQNSSFRSRILITSLEWGASKADRNRDDV
jgi:hypothetical protein